MSSELRDTAHKIFIKAMAMVISDHSTNKEEIERIVRQSFIAAEIFWNENLEKDRDSGRLEMWRQIICTNTKLKI